MHHFSGKASFLVLFFLYISYISCKNATSPEEDDVKFEDLVGKSVFGSGEARFRAISSLSDSEVVVDTVVLITPTSKPLGYAHVSVLKEDSSLSDTLIIAANNNIDTFMVSGRVVSLERNILVQYTDSLPMPDLQSGEMSYKLNVYDTSAVRIEGEYLVMTQDYEDVDIVSGIEMTIHTATTFRFKKH